jgi:hypothetical protein
MVHQTGYRQSQKNHETDQIHADPFRGKQDYGHYKDGKDQSDFHKITRKAALNRERGYTK